MKDFAGLLKEMSLEEKLLQLLQVAGELYMPGDSGKLMGISYGFEVDDFMAWNAGSVLGLEGAEASIRLQREHMKNSAHKIPLLFMHDVIHGYRTTFPSPLAMACSWQPGLLERAAEISAKEASAAGVHVTFSPMSDLARDARWGRAVEGYGEDPLLNALYSAAAVRGYQGENGNPREKHRLASCVKHFAGYGMAEAGRDYNTTEISEYSLREYHFPAYKAALDAGCRMVMTSFNALNGVPATGNSWLLGDILRKEWGFDGLVISDCTAVIELVMHGFAEDNDEAALKALTAGVDIEMVSTAFFRGASRLIEQGRLDKSVIDEAVMRVLQFKDWLGLFENPYKDADPDMEKALFLCGEHRSAARDIARSSMVLLKNDGLLPLSKSRGKVAVVGNYAENKDIIDIWRVAGRPEDCVSIAEGLTGKLDFTALNGCGEESLRLAARSDLVILAVGESPDMSAEAGSRAYIGLPEEQERFAEQILDLGKPVAAVVFSGRPLALGALAEKANAILQAWFPGCEGGNAIADILLGECEPSGRLTMSFPVTAGQCPVYYNAFPTGRPVHSPADGERFRSRYIDAPIYPLYPFGHGLTYTSFSYSDVRLSEEELHPGGTITASIVLTNTGRRSGTETVQLYLRDMAGSMTRPLKELKSFARVTLEPGEERSVSFALTEETLRFNTMDQGFASEKGRFRVYIGENALTENAKEFTLV